MGELAQISEMVESHIPLFAIDTLDTEQVTRAFRDYGRATGTPVFMWRPAMGLHESGSDERISGTREPADVLKYILGRKEYAIYLLCQFPAWTPHTDIELQLRSLAECQGKAAYAVFLVGSSGSITPGLRPHCYHLRYNS